jgi:hypothetical protein
VIPKAEQALQKARDAKQGNYNSVVHAGSLCASREEWDATNALIQYNITRNIDGAAKAVKAETRDEATKDGAKFKMPRSITNAMSVIGFAWENGVPLAVVNKETGKLETVTFGSLRKARTAKLDADKQAKAESLTGVAKLRHECGVMIGKLQKALGEDLTDANIQTIHARLTELVGGPKSAPKAEQPATAKAPKARAGRKSPKADVADDLAEAA